MRSLTTIILMGENMSEEHRKTLLCLRSKANIPVLDETLRHFHVIIVNDSYHAVRSANLGTYDVIMAFDTRTGRAALHAWDKVREVDRNTPFLLVCGTCEPDQVARMRPGYDAFLEYPCGLNELLRTLRRVIATAERRNLIARSEEIRAISQEIRDRLGLLERRLAVNRAAMARAEEHVVRARAMAVFARAGGTRAGFEAAWPSVFEDIVAASHSLSAAGSGEKVMDEAADVKAEE